MQEKIIVNLSQEETIQANVPDINYIPGYKVAEEERRSNELERQAYYEEIQRKVNNGEFDGEQGPQGEQGIQGPKGDAGSVKFIIVNELPTKDIDESAMYLKKLVDEEEQNTYEEYIFVNGVWELVGTAKVEVDLTGYVKNTDYATGSKAGVVKTNGNYGTAMNGDTIIINAATNAMIDSKDNGRCPIVPSRINYMFEKQMPTLTQDEYDALETKDENLIYLIVEE